MTMAGGCGGGVQVRQDDGQVRVLRVGTVRPGPHARGRGLALTPAGEGWGAGPSEGTTDVAIDRPVRGKVGRRVEG